MTTSKYSKETIISALHQWVHMHGRTPSSIEFHSDPTVPSMTPIRKLFGGFGNLLREAGYPVNRNIHVDERSKEAVKNLSEGELSSIIQNLGKTLGRAPTFEECREHLRELSIVIDPRNYLHKSWSGILLDCGLQPARRGRNENEELENLKQWIAEHGHVPTVSEINDDPKLPTSTYFFKHFLSYEKALEILKQKPHRKSRWSDEELINTLQTFAEQHGRTPCTADFKSSEPPYWTTFGKRFGSWANALEAAGLNPNHRLYGHMYRSNHGHIRPSWFEGQCDDILGAFGIAHEHDVPYRNYVETDRLYNFDVVVNDTWFIEMAGMIRSQQWIEKSGFNRNTREAEYFNTLSAKVELLESHGFQGHLILIFGDNDIFEVLKPVIESNEIVNTTSGKVIAPRIYNHSMRERYTNDMLVENIKRIAAELNRQPTLADMRQPGMPYPSVYTKRQKWSEWLKDAGFSYQYHYQDDELMTHLSKLEQALGKVPERCDVVRHGTHSDMLYYRRFGSQWQQVIDAYERWKAERKM